MLKSRKFPLKITGCPKLEGTCEDHWVQFLTLRKAIYKLDFTPKSIVQMFLEHRETWRRDHFLGVGLFQCFIPKFVWYVKDCNWYIKIINFQ